jgi:hypothetical protein
MRKEWILTDEEKCLKRRKIERNRIIKQQAKLVLHQEPNDLTHSNIQTNPNKTEVNLSHKYFKVFKKKGFSFNRIS